jgi:branched-subunit amino acid transport protein
VNAWSALAIVVMVGAMTYVMRAGVIVALAGRPIPEPVERVLRNVGPAVLAALAINLAAGGDGGPGLEFAEVAALVVAGGVALWRRNLIWTLLAGMATLWLLSSLT